MDLGPERDGGTHASLWKDRDRGWCCTARSSCIDVGSLGGGRPTSGTSGAPPGRGSRRQADLLPRAGAVDIGPARGVAEVTPSGAGYHPWPNACAEGGHSRPESAIALKRLADGSRHHVLSVVGGSRPEHFHRGLISGGRGLLPAWRFGQSLRCAYRSAWPYRDRLRPGARCCGVWSERLKGNIRLNDFAVDRRSIKESLRRYLGPLLHA